MATKSGDEVSYESGPDRAADRRRRVIDAARDLFVAHGFHNTGIAQIAQRSGVLVGQIYRDFSGKEDIVAAIVERDMATFLDDDTLDRAIAAGDRTHCRQWLAEFVDSEDAGDECALMAEIMAEAGRNTRIAGIFQSIHEKVRAKLMTALVACLDERTTRSELDAFADTIMAMSFGMMCTRITQPTKDLAPATRIVQATMLRELDRMCEQMPA